MAVDFFPSDVVFLFQFFGFYEQDCRQTPCIPIEDESEEKYLAVFSSNLLFCFCPDQAVVETISFLSTKHVTTCQCEICGVIRQVTANPSLIQRRSQKETVH
jgi:hypothetical protein